MAPCAVDRNVFHLEITGDAASGTYEVGTTTLTSQSAMFGTTYFAYPTPASESVLQVTATSFSVPYVTLLAQVSMPERVAPGTYSIQASSELGLSVNFVGDGVLTGTFGVEELTPDLAVATSLAMWFEATGNMHLRGCVRYRQP